MIHKMCHMELTGNSLLLTKKWQVTKSDNDQNESSRVTKSFWFALPSQNKVFLRQFVWGEMSSVKRWKKWNKRKTYKHKGVPATYK